MDYPYEQLDPETFQQFCQALLVLEQPNLRSFPVAQPDGGRDAIARPTPNSGNRFRMYQVKFVRDITTLDDPKEWLSEIIKKEVPKIDRQIPMGAEEFILITNVKGTAHLGAGTIDRIAKILEENIHIPSRVIWRDDLNRRLDGAWDLKWAYPQLMTGPDLIRSLIEQQLSEDKERRSRTIKSFLSDQFSIDEEVKFKQVELQNKLFDLFIDVPISVPHQPNGRGDNSWYQHYLDASSRAINYRSGEAVSQDNLPFSSRFIGNYYDQMPVGAATFLLDSEIQKKISFIVLEGAPGQGKSTIAQYVAQIHRMKLLNKSDLLSKIPQNHRQTSVRFPLKVDLRDFATWLGGRDPFDPDNTQEQPHGWIKSLESFLSALIRYHSGGSEFSVNDLLAVLSASPVLIIFDGLDEVADIIRRKDVVEEINRGIKRIKDHSMSIQVIVTSRPTAFENCPGFEDNNFHYFQLGSVTPELIDEYSDKWIRSKKLSSKDGSGVKRILKEKLALPHLKDLARNPMQLAILLSLIHTRGTSLPDKRTALYDSYIELFFNRESEKSTIIRDQRDLIVNIHRYIAWVLHTEAEQSESNGSISGDRLKLLLTEYLRNEGHDPGLAEKLFTGMVERVVALVSRVQGTYEFEVQPLREYFAARFLYDTAPYSPPGNEKGGTKPDRFDALSRNFYWLNVTRFFAGCFSKGELPSIVDRLQELSKSEGFSRISHPRMLAATLLSDWVFAQHPKSIKEVITLILDEIGLRHLVSHRSRRYSTGPAFTLPSSNGREELIDSCFKLLNNGVPFDFAESLIEVIRNNASIDEMTARWLKLTNQTDKNQEIDWIEYGLHLGILHKLELEQLNNIVEPSLATHRNCEIFTRAQRWDYLEQSEDIFNKSIDYILDEPYINWPESKRKTSLLGKFLYSISPNRYAIALSSQDPISLSELWKHRIPDNDRGDTFSCIQLPYAYAKRCNNVTSVAEKGWLTLAREWATDISPWDNLIESLRSEFGDRLLTYHLATLSSGIKSSKETCNEYNNLHDKSVSLSKRARYARLRAGNHPWWEKTIEKIENDSDTMLTLILLLIWGSSGTLIILIEYIDQIINRLPMDKWQQLIQILDNCSSLLTYSNSIKPHIINVSNLPSNLSCRTIVSIGLRSNEETKSQLFTKYLSRYDGNDVNILGISQSIAIQKLLSRDKDCKQLLDIISKSYLLGTRKNSDIRSYYMHQRGQLISLDSAKIITGSPSKYPSELLWFAEEVCKKDVASRIVSVGKIAAQGEWKFD